MRKIYINITSIITISIGAFLITSADVSASSVIYACNWQLQCVEATKEYVCCTVCPTNGAIGSCRVVPKPELI